MLRRDVAGSPHRRRHRRTSGTARRSGRGCSSGTRRPTHCRRRGRPALPCGPDCAAPPQEHQCADAQTRDRAADHAERAPGPTAPVHRDGGRRTRPLLVLAGKGVAAVLRRMEDELRLTGVRPDAVRDGRIPPAQLDGIAGRVLQPAGHRGQVGGLVHPSVDHAARLVVAGVVAGSQLKDGLAGHHRSGQRVNSGQKHRQARQAGHRPEDGEPAHGHGEAQQVPPTARGPPVPRQPPLLCGPRGGLAHATSEKINYPGDTEAIQPGSESGASRRQPAVDSRRNARGRSSTATRKL